MSDLWVFLHWLMLPRWTPDRAAWMRFYSAYLRTDHWRTFSRWHRAWWTWDGKCQLCRKRRAEQVHHKRGAYRLMWCEWLAPWEFVNVCSVCHARHHTGK